MTQLQLQLIGWLQHSLVTKIRTLTGMAAFPGGGSVILREGPEILFFIMMHSIMILFTTPSLSWWKVGSVSTLPAKHARYWRKAVNYELFLIYENRMITWSRTWPCSLTKISFIMIWPGPHIDQNSICLKHTNKYTSYKSMSTRQCLQQSLAHSGAKWCR